MSNTTLPVTGRGLRLREKVVFLGFLRERLSLKKSLKPQHHTNFLKLVKLRSRTEVLEFYTCMLSKIFFICIGLRSGRLCSQ